jgi:aspartate aminotransferase
MKVSEMADGLVGSEIIKLAGEIKSLEAQGESIYNFTIGDFDANIFPLPTAYKQAILDAYNDNQTNYPPANGILPLREAAAKFTQKTCGLDYTPDEFLVAGGSRPLIFATYSALVDPGDKILFPVPSWNNNHYTHLHRANSILIETKPENNFMPSLEDLAPHLSSSTLLALCSPLNPTGTVFSEEQLRPICEAVLEENKKREAENKKPLYILFDQIYQALCHDAVHCDPITLVPELRPYCIYIDGLSKAFAATGVRVGYAFGPQTIINKMKAILGHVGAWAPKAEQVASAKFLNQEEEVDAFLIDFKKQIYLRLNTLHEGFTALKSQGFPVDSIKPQAAIYLTVKLDLLDSVTGKNNGLKTIADVCAHLLKEAKLAIVPFKAFGASETSPWFRISVGTCKIDELEDVLTGLKSVLTKLK